MGVLLHRCYWLLKTWFQSFWPPWHIKLLLLQGLKLTFLSGSHLAPKYFKVVANSKKLVAILFIMTKKHFFYPDIVLDRFKLLLNHTVIKNYSSWNILTN